MASDPGGCWGQPPPQGAAGTVGTPRVPGGSGVVAESDPKRRGGEETQGTRGRGGREGEGGPSGGRELGRVGPDPGRPPAESPALPSPG